MTLSETINNLYIQLNEKKDKDIVFIRNYYYQSKENGKINESRILLIARYNNHNSKHPIYGCKLKQIEQLILLENNEITISKGNLIYGEHNSDFAVCAKAIVNVWFNEKLC